MEQVIGIAAAKRPSPQADTDVSQESARFIESVWIAEGMRGERFGERLLTFLIEKQREEGIQRFYLWVFARNKNAINLYERMNFKEAPVGESNRPKRVDEAEKEKRYLLAFDSDIIEGSNLTGDAAARERDWDKYGVYYRVLQRGST